MPERPIIILAVLSALLLGAGVLFYIGFSSVDLGETEPPPSSRDESFRNKPSDLGKNFIATGRADAMESMSNALELAELKRLLNAPAAIDGEAVLTFQTDDALQRFLDAAARLGLRVLGVDPRTRSVRIGFDSTGDLHASLAGLDPGDYEVGANFLYLVPSIPAAPDNPGQVLVPFGRRTLDWLGIAGDNTAWGRGLTIAILDTGIDGHATFRDGQVRLINFLEGAPNEGDLGHGTAVASLVAGNDPSAPGIAPGADLLSYAVINAAGTSDSFTLATALYDAIARNVDLVNISLGSYGNSSYLQRAIDDAVAAGIFVVAAAGNEGQNGRLTYPAAYEGVISVGAVDALGQHVYYSNTSDDLSISAPGIGVSAAWEGGELVSFSGTSASTPYVTGALAAILSENPGITLVNAQQLLFDHANEAGIAGPDPEYGNGTLDVGGIMQRNTSGIYDVAVASQTFGDPTVPTNNANPTIDVAIENRGTEPLYNVAVQVSSPGIDRDFTIPVLLPNAVVVVQAPIDYAQVRTDGSVEVVSTATLTGAGLQDADNRDNRQTSIVNIQAP